MNIPQWHRHKTGLSLIELLCVMAIISMLAALYVGTISKAFLHAKKVLGH